ncbi:winged helix DNA-binding domain-containing protein [Nocardia sp. NBC_01503]|uniref:winged helix DNA-binding domain-containing protein n=1 Tax=Nocardia sp. NBC_01503 TaxID=2975997 RepID=UPI002E7C10FD|nr:winged helix DNA-binding domain-containing protein [Nocardia sp. NBC_01503]WTL33143.1 winged helix DNA-binding domain-containing protein [Nocardia sp. NBC_01503]
MKELSLRQLNRTLLARQMLTERVSMPAADLIRHLIAVQGQEANWPFIGLWTRLTDFEPAELNSLLHDRTVVRGTMIRRTVHLAHAEDYRWLYPTVRPTVEQSLRLAYYREACEHLDHTEFATAGRRLLTGRTLTRTEIGRTLAERFPTPHPDRLSAILGQITPLVHHAEAGTWGAWRNRRVSVSLAEEWIGAPLAERPDPEQLILRYLAAFGPATVADIQSWSGVTKLAEVVARLRPQLRVLRDDTGRELFDIPDAPLADPNLPVPVRFLPAFDNALLAHKDRRRAITDEDRSRITKIASGGVPMYLVDGFVHGRWDLRGETLRITPWHPMTSTDEAAVRAAAEELLPMVLPNTTGGVAITPA